MPTPTESVSTEALVEALRAMVREEVTTVVRASIDDAVSDAIAEIRATVAESANAPSGDGAAATRDEIMALAPDICAHPEFQTEIRKQLEEAFQGVLPGLVKRLRGEIEKRLQSGDVGGGGGGVGGASIMEVVRSNELKEVLEERFRTMLTYLQQDVIPSAIRKG